jgi:hypothetical protein
MSPGFTAEPLTLGRLFSDPYSFRVPSFQRPYSWTTKEAGQLLDDLTLALEEQASAGDDEERGYFLGAMLLTAPVSAGTDDAEFVPRHDIVDGQQRLVTLTILLAVLRDLMGASESKAASDWLAQFIESPLEAGQQRSYRLELRGGEHEFLKTYVQERGASARMPDGDVTTEAQGRILAVREHFLAELGQRDRPELARITSFVVQACHIALISANSIDGAHRIFMVLNDRGRPLARNDILKAQVLGQISEGARQSALDIWDRTAALVGEDFEPLFSHIRAVEGGTKGQIISGIRDIIANAGGAQVFVKSVLEPYGRALHAVRSGQHEGSEHSPEIRRLLSYLHWLGSADWVPPALLWWRLNGDDPEQLVVFLRRLERLAYSLRLLGLGADKRLSRFRGVVRAIHNGNVFDSRTSPLDLGRDEQRNILYNLRNLHVRSPLTCKLVLLRLNDELAGVPQNLSPPDLTVEHVLPQKPSRNSVWRTWFPTADEREACVNSVGNLVLVTRAQNEMARNNDLARKLTAYFENGAVPHITRELAGIAEWRAPQILAREERLMALIRAIWELDTPAASPIAAVSEPVPPPVEAKPVKRRRLRLFASS